MKLTDAAAKILKEERAQVGLPSDACPRIRSAPGAGEDPGLQLGFVLEPAPTDQIVDHPDLRVFVSAELTDTLADCTLDVKDTHDGSVLVLR
jgi:Fe-S cluster assembly iron-binding protein IscA